MELFDGFVAALREHPEITRVDVVESPFALEADTAISGDSGVAARDRRADRAAYRVLIRMGGSPDE